MMNALEAKVIADTYNNSVEEKIIEDLKSQIDKIIFRSASTGKYSCSVYIPIFENNLNEDSFIRISKSLRDFVTPFGYTTWKDDNNSSVIIIGWKG